MSELIEVNPKKLGGKPLFRGTRIPISYLAQYLNEGRSVEDFIEVYDIDPDLVRQVYEEKFEDDPSSDKKKPA